MINGVRRSVVWKRLDTNSVGPSAGYHSFAEHHEIIEAIADRNRSGAADAMRRHLCKARRSC